MCSKVRLKTCEIKQKKLLQLLQKCNDFFAKLLLIALCNNHKIIALQYYCNDSVHYWPMSVHGTGGPRLARRLWRKLSKNRAIVRACLTH